MFIVKTIIAVVLGLLALFFLVPDVFARSKRDDSQE
jgi:hypothetical protein